MGALRKVVGRTLIDAVPGRAATPATQVCTVTPDEPQYRPPVEGDDDSGGFSGCYWVPFFECREAGDGDSASERVVCGQVGVIEICL
jgi:hypothetical protein